MKEGLDGYAQKKALPSGFTGPCRRERKGLYQRRLHLLIRSRNEGGPERTRSFLLPEPGWRLARTGRKFRWAWPQGLPARGFQTATL